MKGDKGILEICAPSLLRPPKRTSRRREAHIARPKRPDRLDDAAWADYLFMRANPKGRHLERWLHAHGCRRWFNLARDTLSHDILAAYRMQEKPSAAARKARGRR